MPINTPQDITAAVLAALQGASDARFKEIMGAAVRHLHAFATEVRLSEAEFQQACAVVARLGQATNDSHNEVVLAAGSTGLSALVCLLNNGDAEQGTTANMLGPFWRANAPITASGASILRGPTAGAPLLVNAWVHDALGQPVLDAEVDVWHSSSAGYYENQDPAQADNNLRGKFSTNADGHFSFTTIKPQGYPIPVNGPVGDFLRKQGRHNMRPAHIHFLIHKPGFKTQFSQVYASDDPNLSTDVQFGVTERLTGHCQRHNEPNPTFDMTSPWYSLDFRFVIQPGVARWPRAPITGRAQTPAPAFEVLQAHSAKEST